MPSFFPGMDPYLEHPAMWPSVHQGLITFMWTALNAALPSRYVASVGERLFVVQPSRDIYPDVAVYEQPRPATPNRGGVATMSTAGDLPLVVIVDPIEMREVYIEILALGNDGERVVTIIEVLSPANKTGGNRGRELYLAKQNEVLASQTHLIEIDLLRHGEHTVAVPFENLSRRKDHWDYVTCLHRGGQGARYEVWPVSLRERLPRIRIPLAEGDPDVALDLQAIFERCYDEGGYARRIDYLRAPHTPLNDADTKWADALAREKGIQK